MYRRAFLTALPLAAACARAAPRRSGDGRIRAVAFDLFTIFDPRSIDAAVIAEMPDGGSELAALWKLRAFEYCWLRAAGGQYERFDRILEASLEHALVARQVSLSPASRSRMIAAWTELAPWPDAPGALEAMRASGLTLAPLANFAPAMIESLLARAGLLPLFAHLLSTDLARTYKPAATAYQLGVDAFGVPPAQIAFSAFGGWDAAGAAWFGYPTYWVNRLGVARDRLGPEVATGPNLDGLAEWVRG
jgi:2-haloacid dehalogenase